MHKGSLKSSIDPNSEPASMELSCRISIIIYVLVFIFAKLFHCIDVSFESSAGAVNESTNISVTTESISPDQIPLDGSIQPQENGDVMQICNQSFPTPKGIVYGDVCINKFTKLHLFPLKWTNKPTEWMNEW